MSFQNTKLTASLFSIGLLLISGCNSSQEGAGIALADTPSVSGSDVSKPLVSGTPVVTNAPISQPSSPQPSNQGPTPVVGESCTGDSSKTCLAIHFVSYMDSNKRPTANQAQTATIIHEMNQLWAQCGIGFQVEKYDMVDPGQYNLSYGSQSQNETDDIRKAFQQPSNQLLAVTTGPWGTSVNAWTNMPGEGLYGAIMEASIVTYGNGIIYAHEFGHYLGLDHESDSSNLMNPVIYTSSTSLYSSQCQTARDSATSDWSAMIRH